MPLAARLSPLEPKLENNEYPGKASSAGEIDDTDTLGSTSVTKIRSGSSPHMAMASASLLLNSWSALVYQNDNFFAPRLSF